LNFFEPTEQRLLRALQRPEFNIHGMRRADLTAFVPEMSPSCLSRQLHRLRSLGLLKRVTRSYRYYLTRLGRGAIAAASFLTEFQIIPALAAAR
jgi:DNA-binding HxlR family transcriptional regulator